jgi:hypothetical protein
VELSRTARFYIFYLLPGAAGFGSGLERVVSFTPKKSASFDTAFVWKFILAGEDHASAINPWLIIGVSSPPHPPTPSPPDP